MKSKKIYNESRKMANRNFKYKKRAFTKNILEEAETNYKEHNTRQVYPKINAQKYKYK